MTAVDPPASPPPSATPEPKRGMSTVALVLIILGAVVALLVVMGGLIFWGVFALTAAPVTAADAFFAATARSGPAVSYNLASPSFRSVVPEAQWEAYARRYGLAGYTGASWSSRNVTNNVATLQGSLKISGGALPATVQLTQAGAGWQVLHLTLADGGVASGSASDMASSAATTGDPAAATNTSADTDTAGGGQGAPVVAPPPTAQPARQIPGVMLAGLCRQVLAQQARAAFDSIQCPDSLTTKPGATTACMVRKGGQSMLMTARLDSFDAATGRFTVNCKVADHPLS